MPVRAQDFAQPRVDPITPRCFRSSCCVHRDDSVTIDAYPLLTSALRKPYCCAAAGLGKEASMSEGCLGRTSTRDRLPWKADLHWVSRFYTCGGARLLRLIGFEAEENGKKGAGRTGSRMIFH
jgi:hypothetical protein